MRSSYRFVGACLGAALLAACEGTGLSSSTAAPAGPQIGIPALHLEPGRPHSAARGVTLKYLHSFGGGIDGRYPNGALISLNGTLYGTTYIGGADGWGAVYSITPSGAENVVYSFLGSPDGADPTGSLVSLGGTFYGATYSGGGGAGTVYSVTPSGTEKVIQPFYDGSFGAKPGAGLTVVAKKLYGTTTEGGAYHHGVVFSLRKSGAEAVLHSFGGSSADGMSPDAPLLRDGNVLYGTTSRGGAYSGGTLFAIDLTTEVETVLHSFGSDSADGSYPTSGRLLLVNGILYGTTHGGGTDGRGTVYSINPASSSSYGVMYSFKGGSDGCNPHGGLVYYKKLLYGTTNFCGAYDNGMIFAIDPTSGAFTTVWAFGDAPGGRNPQGDLLIFKGAIYGTTRYGGADGSGTIYSLVSRP